MGQQPDLQTVLEDLVDEGGKVYSQPPSNNQMVFPCIIFKLDSVSVQHADNTAYRATKRWEVTYITRASRSLVFDRLLFLPRSKFIRRFVKDGLYHDIFQVYHH